MPRLQKVFKKRKGKYYPRKNTINSKVSTTDCKLNAQAEHAHDSKQSCAKEKKIPDLNESFSSFGDSVEFSSSNFHEGTQIATINTRFVYAMRSIGKGAEAGRMFCGVMNLPQPPTRFSPYGKVIDVDILSKYCACKNLPFHEKDCKRNYVGSSGAMEIQGASKIFQRSLSLHNARYITYLGDGDCKAFDVVKKKNIYGNEYPIEKLECIGHVMKRMGTRLHRLKAQLKGQILSDGKWCLSGKNRLTEHEIDNLQSYYGPAIREITAVFRICGKLSGPFFCISYQLMNILNMVLSHRGRFMVWI
ncbi:uncharacterized protein TNCV_1881361 [Trichonephila clavipes]|nr:uncharacterized protein TNCV_1881361 [Trichonephila clavipes]